jgi:mono/diheme cytochrome c family protein
MAYALWQLGLMRRGRPPPFKPEQADPPAGPAWAFRQWAWCRRLVQAAASILVFSTLALWVASTLFEWSLEAGTAPRAAGLDDGVAAANGDSTRATKVALAGSAVRPLSPGIDHLSNGFARGAARAAANRPEPVEQVRRGEYVARLGNCAGCHTAVGGLPLAGGRAVVTPFGEVMAGNLTPDDATGLGAWTAQDLWVALRLGRSRDGRLLLPAFPYTHYTLISRADSDALYAYLRSVPAVAVPPKSHALRFPYNTAAAVAIWRLLFFRPGVPNPDTFAPASSSYGEYTRGAYLVEGLGHCGACHAPRSAWGVSSGELSGSLMPGLRWYAPSLLPGAPGQGSLDETVSLLKTGGSRLGRAVGPMAAVVKSSLQYWSDADLRAAVGYLQSRATFPLASPAAAKVPAGLARVAESDGLLFQRGALLYREDCAGCHGAQGEGVHGIYPALAGNGTVLQPTTTNLLQVITYGGFGPTTAGNPRPFGMPPGVYSDADMAAVMTFVRTAWGHQAGAVTPLEVLQMRR